MASLDDIRAARLKKLELLQTRGRDPYPVSAHADATLKEAAEDFTKLSKKKKITLAGRVMALRGQGGLVFADLFDGTGKFQALFKKDELPGGAFELWSDAVDIGDFVEVAGALFLTKRSERTLAVKEWRMLAKALRPLPEKWHGLTDTEERFRRRYLDTLMNEEARARFFLRSCVISSLRRLLDAAGFLEVETSILQPLAGGANAEPFRTHHNALDIDLHLRIAPELDLKKLLIGGFPKVYEIGRSFRNEGIDVMHNPEFTTVEWYEAYSDAKRQRALVETVIRGVVAAATGKTAVIFDGSEIDFAKPFATHSYFELLQRYALLAHPEKAAEKELALKAEQLGARAEGKSIAKLFDAIFKKAVRPKLIQPTFVTDYPKEAIPLAKANEGNAAFVDAFQLYAGGIELVKAFSELNDPQEQAVRFKLEEAHRQEGERDAQPNDREFVEALEFGCPPAGGVGLGIERLVMLLTDTHNIREVIFFPTLRPK